LTPRPSPCARHSARRPRGSEPQGGQARSSWRTSGPCRRASVSMHGNRARSTNVGGRRRHRDLPRSSCARAGRTVRCRCLLELRVARRPSAVAIADRAATMTPPRACGARRNGDRDALGRRSRRRCGRRDGSAAPPPSRRPPARYEDPGRARPSVRGPSALTVATGPAPGPRLPARESAGRLTVGHVHLRSSRVTRHVTVTEGKSQ
jgi:hypothetical protein